MKQTNDAINDPRKVIRAEAEALLMELELAKTRIERLAKAADNPTAFSEIGIEARVAVTAVRRFRAMLDDLQFICDMEKAEVPPPPSPPPKMVAA